MMVECKLSAERTVGKGTKEWDVQVGNIGHTDQPVNTVYRAIIYSVNR